MTVSLACSLVFWEKICPLLSLSFLFFLLRLLCAALRVSSTSLKSVLLKWFPFNFSVGAIALPDKIVSAETAASVNLCSSSESL